jgi:hypothetical protein
VMVCFLYFCVPEAPAALTAAVAETFRVDMGRGGMPSLRKTPWINFYQTGE